MVNNFTNINMSRFLTFHPRNILVLFFSLLLLLFSNHLYGQNTIVEWNFDDSNNIADGGLLVNQSKTITSESRTNYQYFTGFSGQSISLTNWVSGQDSKYWIVEFETTGYDNLTLSSKQRSSDRGPADFKLEYSTNGIDWAEISGGAITVGLDWTTGEVIDLPLPSALNDQGSVYIRWIMTSNDAVVINPIFPTGTSRIDEIIVLGFPIAGAPTVDISSNSPVGGIINAGSINNELYRMDFTVSNNDATLTDITFIPDGTYDVLDLDSFSLWYSSDGNFDQQSDELLGTEPPVPSGNNLSFNGLSKTTIPGTTGYFFLTVNVDQNAFSNTIFITSTDFDNIVFNPPSIKLGTNPAAGSNTQTIKCFDFDTDVFDSFNQPSAGIIQSMATDPSQAVRMFEFYIFDQGNCDGLPTYVTNIRLKRHSTNTADWPSSIGGIVLRNQGDGISVPNTTTSVFNDYLDITIPSGDLMIPDGDFKIIEVEVYLSDAGSVVEESVLSFFVDYNDHGFLADTQIGSGFIDEFFIGADFNSNDFTIDVVASQLSFVASNQPITTAVNQPMEVDVLVEATDANGNRDLGFAGLVELTSSGSLLNSPLQVNAINGVATFSGITHSLVGTNLQLTANSSGLSAALSNAFDIIVLDEDFGTCPPTGWTSVLISGNGWTCGSGYASVTGIGGSNPTEAWYLMPSIDFSTLSDVVLSFNIWTGGLDLTHPTLEVVYSTNYAGSGNPNLATWTSLNFNTPDPNSQTWTPSGTIDLSSLSTQAYIAFKYTSTGNVFGAAAEWRIDNVSVTENGCLTPTTQASNLTFTNIASTSMTLNWDSGNGTGRIVLAKEGGAVDQVPVDLTTYIADADFTVGQDIGGGNIVVYLGNASSADITGLTENTEYHFAVYEYNCDAATPVFNTVLPAIGSQFTTDPNASDIIVDDGFAYPQDIDYTIYQAPSLTMDENNSLSVFGLALRDGGPTGNRDGLNTTLTAISFSTNGSQAIRAAAIFDGTNFIGAVNVNGGTSFTIDLSSNPIIANDNPPPSNRLTNFELKVTFMQGDFIIDNDQIVFTVTNAIADPSGTLFIGPDAGGVTSIQAPDGTGNENVIRVNATSLSFVQVPASTIIVDSPFTIEVEAIDDDGTKDLDKILDLSLVAGSGIITSGSGLQRTTALGTAIWDDLRYDTEELSVQFQVADNLLVLTPITTNLLNAKSGLSVYTFTGAAGDEPDFAPDSQPVNLTIGNISRGSDLVAQTFSDAFNARSWSQTSLPEDNYFYEFTISADAGYDFTISSIELDHRRSGTGPPLWVVRSSVDNYTANIGGFFSTPAESVWFTNEEIPFGTNVQDQSSVTIRLYAYNANSALGTWTIDNLYIFGTVRDSQAPEFTTGYPQSDSTAVDGFDLLVNLTETATVYYVVQDPALVTQIPSATQVVDGFNGDGVAAEAADTITVTAATTDFYERVTGLISDNVYDVYYVLYDSTNYSPVIPQTSIRTSDTDTDLAVATQPTAPFEIPSTATDAGTAVNVFNFQVADAGTADGVPTHVTKLVFNAGINNTVIDWSTVIGGAALFNTTQGAPVTISNVTVNTASLEIDINPGDLMIADASQDELALSIWLTNTVPDNESIELAIGGNPHTNTTSRIGSQFSNTLTALTSNIYTITVTAVRLNITDFTPSITNISNQEISIFVEATDVNLNIDLDETTDVSVVLGQGSGSISTLGGGPLTLPLINGAVDWQDIRYSADNEIITLIANSATLQDDTTGSIIIGSPTDLIVPAGTSYLLSSDLTVDNVIINDGGTLTITSGVRLVVREDYTFNGSGTLVDQGATTVFIGRPNTLQTITKIPAGPPEQFYNIEIDQPNNADGVYNEMSIELLNSLIMTDGDFYIAGAGNNQDFTLVSTASNTARIAEMADGTSIIGDVIWQRSLRTGPAGFRYIGTPMKGQSLANIRDDVWIQGVTGSYPGAWTNISTYTEAIGTEGEGGFEGWTDFTALSNSLTVGQGMKLYLWSVDYATEQIISMKGAPTIGDGGDGTAGSSESITLNTSWTSSAYDGGGWNFLANPYPSEIDWNAVIKNGNINGGAVHIWNPSSQQYDTYSSATQTGTNGLTQYVASGQGFFVKADAAGASIELSESTKSSANGNSFLRMSDEPLAKLMVEINASNGSKDQTAVAFADFASDGYDPQFDARKLSAGWVNLATVLDNKSIAINAMGEKRGVQSVRLNIEPYVYGSYTLKFPSIEAFTEGATVRLVDKYLDKSTYINSTSSYAFSIDEHNAATYGADRFEIQFVEPARFRFDNPNAKAGQEFVMPVFADKLEDILSTDMGLSWDSEALTFIGIEDVGIGNMGDFDLSHAEQGRLIFHDENQDPLGLPDGTQIFAIRFRANNGMPQAQLRFEQAYMSLQATNNIDMPFSSEDVLIDIQQNRFVAGAITTYSGEFVNEVVVKAENAEETIEHMSDLSGTYKLDTYEQSGYTVSGQKIDNRPLTEAVTTLDVIKTRSHILRKEEFVSPYQWVAADVNDSKSITALDLVEMRKVILGINPAFQSGLDWLIIPEAYDLTDDPFSYQTSMDIMLSDQDQDLNFIGVKVGDVDNSWSGQGGARKSKDYLALSMENLVLNDDLVEIPVVVSEYNDIRGYQFSITWDPNELAYDGTTSELLEGFFNDQMASNGVLTTMWDELDGRAAELISGQTLFTLKFRALREDAVSQVDINSAVTEAIAVDGKLNNLSIRAVPANVNLEELRNGKLELLQNIPNPFDYSTQIDFKIAKPGLATFTIINTLGEIVYIHEDNYKTGMYSISWDRSQSLRSIAPGMYLYRLESNGEEVVKKMMIK